MARSSLAIMVMLGVLTSCGVVEHVPYPLDLSHKLPSDAFDRCRKVLLDSFGAVEESDRDAFRLSSAWLPVSDPVGERRAIVSLDTKHENSLAVIVELRWLTIPWFGTPHWTVASGDTLAERQLAVKLREALRDPELIFGSRED